MTPDFPSWERDFAKQTHRLRTTLGPTLHQFEALFTSFIPRWHLAQQDEHAHSRDRCWNLRLVFWTFLWQVAQAGSSCREAIRQAQALGLTYGRRRPPAETSPYCQARGLVPLERLDLIHNHLVAKADAASAAKDLWCGQRVFAVDGSTVTAPDTPENQTSFPQQSVQKRGCGFPIIRIVALLSLATGLVTAWATGNWHQHELTLLQTLWDCLRPGDVLLGDRGFCTWGLLAQCLHCQVHAVFRVEANCGATSGAANASAATSAWFNGTSPTNAPPPLTRNSGRPFPRSSPCAWSAAEWTFRAFAPVRSSW